jgi:hypothetical protein
MANVSFQTITKDDLDAARNGGTIFVGRIYFVTTTDGAGNQYNFIARGETASTYSILYSNSIGITPALTADRQKISYLEANGTNRTINLKCITVGDYTKGRTTAVSNNIVDGVYMGTLGVGGDITQLPSSAEFGDYYECITAGTYGSVSLVVGDFIRCKTVTPSITWEKVTTYVQGGEIYCGDTLFVAFQKIKYTASNAASVAGGVAADFVNHAGKGGSVHLVATTSLAGFMSSTDKTKLDGIATGANNYTHPASGVTQGTYRKVTVDVNGHVTAGENPTTLSGYGITDAVPSSMVKYSVNDSNDEIPSSKAVRTYIGDQINAAVTGLFEFKGDIAPGSIPTSGVAVGDAYRINAAATVTLNGSSTVLEAGDLIIATAASPSPYWAIIQNNIDLAGIIAAGAGISASLSNGKWTISHANITSTKSTASQSVSFGGSIVAISALTFDGNGHPTGYTEKTFTMPSETSISGLTTNADTSKIMTNLTSSGHALTATYSQLSRIIMTGYAKNSR